MKTNNEVVKVDCEIEVKARLFALASAVATLLDGEWIFNKVHSDAHSKHIPVAVLTNKNNLRQEIILETSVWKNKGEIRIKGVLPRDVAGADVPGTTITIMDTRQPESVANELNRDLLPSFCESFNDFIASLNAADEMENRFRHKVQLLQKVTTSLQSISPRKFSFTTKRATAGALYMFPRTSEVTLSLCLTYADAIRALAFLNSEPEKNEDDGKQLSFPNS
jgi:hypothetical protein